VFTLQFDAVKLLGHRLQRIRTRFRKRLRRTLVGTGQYAVAYAR